MITIVIPTYNRERRLQKTLESVLQQTVENWECIVVDDGSTDGTEKLLRLYSAKDSRISYIKNCRSKGAQGARNSGILAAQGDWICLFDSDDIMHSDYIFEMQKAIENSDSDVFVCYANIRNILSGDIIGALDKVQIVNLHCNLLRERSYIANDVCVIRKDALLNIGLLDEYCPSMQEWDTHIRLSKHCKYHLLPKVLCEWNTGGDDTITKDKKRHVEGRLYIYRKHHSEFRRFAYKHYLNVLFDIWRSSVERLNVIKIAPELLLYIPIKFLVNGNGYSKIAPNPRT